MGPVSWADDLTRLHFRTFQRLAVMCATVFYCVELFSTAYDNDGGAVDLDRERSAFLNGIAAADVNPIGAHVGARRGADLAGVVPRLIHPGLEPGRL